MSSTREQRPRTGAGSHDDPSEPQPSRRLKPSTNLHSAEFHDSLSKVWLTRRALKELDRRTNQANSPQQLASTPRNVTRNTLREIQRFARDGGPDLRDLRHYPAPAEVTSHTSSTSPTSKSMKTRRSSAYTSDFELRLMEHHIYLHNIKSKPRDLNEFRQRILRPRPSLSPSRFSDDAFERFYRENEHVINEGDVMRYVVPTMCGNANIPNRKDLVFTQLDSITNGSTVDAKPDFYDGADFGDVDERVREDIGNYIIPTEHLIAPVAPNFFLEIKAPSGRADVVKQQACYDGALGARAMNKLQSYKQEPIYDGNAYTITSTYHDGQLKMYITHPTAGSGGSTEYHMSHVGSWSITGDLNACRQGLTAFRNGRDWAQEQRDAFFLAANERARSVNVESSLSESFDHNSVSDQTDVEDANNLATDEDPLNPEEPEISADELTLKRETRPNKRRKKAELGGGAPR